MAACRPLVDEVLIKALGFVWKASGIPLALARTNDVMVGIICFYPPPLPFD